MFEYKKEKKIEKENGKTPQIAESFCCLQMMMLRNAQGNYPYYMYLVQWKERQHIKKTDTQPFHVLCACIYKTSDLSIKMCFLS